MFYCRLSHRDRPFEQVDARLIENGRITLGRDPSADWQLADPANHLSRLHCTLTVDGSRLTLVDHSTNGTFLEDGRRPAPDEAVELALRSSFTLGDHTILITEPQDADAASPVTPAADWTDALPAPATHLDGSLIEAFCRGAGLDASTLSSEHPEELMERVGAIYRQTVLGLSALMGERARAKNQYELERTTISSAENNPFKWAASRKLAEDLLRNPQAGFLSDAGAVRASFEDLGGHLTALNAGAQAAVEATVQTLSPEAIELEAKGKESLLRNRAVVCWEIFGRRHESLKATDALGGPGRRAFAEAYLRHLADRAK